MSGSSGAIDWETSYADGEWPWDLGEAAPPLLEMLRTRPRTLWGNGRVVVPGCGLGHDAHAIAAAGHEVLGIDLSPTAVDLATRRYGATEGLTFMVGDFLDPRLPEGGQAAAIFEHTCFCALPPAHRTAYAEAAARWLPAGGVLVGLFFIDPPRREDGEAGPPFRASEQEIRTHFEGLFSVRRGEIPRNSAPDRQGREWAAEMVRNH